MGTVVVFPGNPLVGVLVTPDCFAIMLAKPGAKHAAWQTSYSTLEDAVREAQEGAELCGWRYIGVWDEERLRALEDWRHQTDRGSAA
ncbi:hypothetical protein [Methylobacterium pseudosasicola]|uniref:Uncharacterized protein n=1 Tax=Methylobacterium pseudosasicola TaxID=582667 RepID=A0A1I4UT54_9HYPH|nr:hypothetical protein [Methylobacterium pseudosasicola]SFM91943.1 hypothetical protein SAMN05192568_10768 [Methylobacterium pseudosasicola]